MAGFRSAIKDYELANPIYAGATVTFYAVDQNGAKTSTLATLYASPTGAVTVANPQTLDGDGKFPRPVYISEPVIAEVVGIGISSQQTGIIAPNPTYRGIWTVGQRYFAGDMLSDPLQPHTLYVATQNFIAGEDGNDFDADLAAGLFELVAKGGDTAYFVIDDAGRPGSGEVWRMIVSEPLLLPDHALGCHATALVAATGTAIFDITDQNGAAIGTITFAGSASGTVTIAADHTFDAGDEIRIVAPNPRDATLADIAVTLRLSRTATS